MHNKLQTKHCALHTSLDTANYFDNYILRYTQIYLDVASQCAVTRCLIGNSLIKKATVPSFKPSRAIFVKEQLTLVQKKEIKQIYNITQMFSFHCLAYSVTVPYLTVKITLGSVTVSDIQQIFTKT